MNYNFVLAELRQASLFDLYRLRVAIDGLLDDPVRLLAIKRRLRTGLEIGFFDHKKNRLVAAQVVEIRKTRVTVQLLGSGQRLTIPLCMINLDDVDTDIAPRRDGIDRLSLRIGDSVGFTHSDGRELFGTVIKLNPKRAKIRTPGGVWAVPYAMLFTVIDGEQGHDSSILAGVLAKDDK